MENLRKTESLRIYAEGTQLHIGDIVTFESLPRLPLWKRFLNFFGAGYEPPEPVLQEFIIMDSVCSDDENFLENRIDRLC